MKPIEERTEQIARVHARIGRPRGRLPVEVDGKLVPYERPASPPKRSGTQPEPRCDHPKNGVRRRRTKAADDLLDRLRRGKKGAKFAALYDRGDWQGQGYPSQSEADLALCTMIAVACGGDAPRVDELFRASALMRPKWDDPHYEDGRTYGEETVRKAVAGHGHVIIVPPSVSTSDAPTDEDGQPLMCTDTGNAERLVRQYGEQLRFCHPWKKFLFWDKRRWKLDDRGIAMRYSKNVVRAIYQEAASCEDPELRAQLSSWAFKSEKVDRRRAMVELAKSEPAIVVVPEQLDRDPWLLNCLNGTLDLRTGVLREHRRDDLITKLCPVAYDPDAKAPTFDAFLERVVPPQDIRDFLQRAVGWSITADVSEQVLFFLFGSGANGKSVFLIVLIHMLGHDLAIQAAPELLLRKHHMVHPTERADLFGKRLVSTVEIGAERSFDEELVKQLTGGDRIRARRMHEDFWEFAPTHHLWVAANHKPIIRGTDYAIWRRILLVPFTVTIPERERDKRLLSKLLAELPGILAWAVRGCVAWQQRGLDAPDAVRMATEQYRSEMNVVGRFLDERCVRRSGAKSGATEMFHAFQRWCVLTGETGRSQRAFGDAMTELGVQKRKIGGAFFYLDVAFAGPLSGVGDDWGPSGPSSEVRAFEPPREERRSEQGPDHPQSSPSPSLDRTVPREDALSDPAHADACHACGGTRWWRRRSSALRVCVTCHPPSAEVTQENAPTESASNQ